MKRRPDYIFIALVGGLVVFGLVMLSFASAPTAYQKFNDSFYFVKHQIFYGLIAGVFLFLLCFRIDYRLWRRLSPWIFGLSIVLLGLVFVPGIGAHYGKAQNWLNVLGFSFQPSEFAKLAIILLLAKWLSSKNREELKKPLSGLLPLALIAGLPLALVALEPDLGTMVIILIIAGFVYFVAGPPLIYFLGLGGLSAALFFVLIKLAPYRLARLTTFIHPELDPQGIGYHVNQALLAIGSGRIFGLGLGHSLQKFQYLPEVGADSIFAIIAEELGFIVSILLLFAFIFILLRGFKIAADCREPFGYYTAVGVSIWIAFQAFINIGGMTGILPLTGLPLPFISYGGTALAMTLAAAGIVANISKHKRI